MWIFLFIAICGLVSFEDSHGNKSKMSYILGLILSGLGIVGMSYLLDFGIFNNVYK